MAELHQPVKEQFEVSSPGSFGHAKSLEYLRVF